ncbi:MAG: hypothetical protein ACI957_004367 [Verrucomicrobiales bacterium]|jgi:hypothetical protein
MVHSSLSGLSAVSSDSGRMTVGNLKPVAAGDVILSLTIYYTLATPTFSERSKSEKGIVSGSIRRASANKRRVRR